MTGVKRTDRRAAVIRALDVHKANGLIKDWQHNAVAPWKKGGTERPFWIIVDLCGGGDFDLKNYREALAFVTALASAHEAWHRRVGPEVSKSTTPTYRPEAHPS